MSSTVVRLVNRGEEHPYVIEVTTPGWRGVDATFEESFTLPDDLKQINGLLKQAGVKRWGGSDGKTGMLFMADGTTEFVLEDSTDFETAIKALVRAGWLSPEVPPDAAIN